MIKMQKNAKKVVMGVLIASMVMCGCGSKDADKKNEAADVTFNQLLDVNKNAFANGANVDINIDIDCESEGKQFTFKTKGTIEATEKCAHADIEISSELLEMFGGEKECNFESYIDLEDNKEYRYSEEEQAWVVEEADSGINLSDVKEFNLDYFKDTNVKKDGDNYVATAKVDMEKVLKEVNKGSEGEEETDEQTELYKKAEINLTMTFDKDKKVTSVVFDVDKDSVKDIVELNSCKVEFKFNEVKEVKIPEDVKKNAIGAEKDDFGDLEF